MDRKDIVRISNGWFTKSIGIIEVKNVLYEYCIDKGKITKEASFVSENLITPQIFATIGYKAFEFALEYYWKKFNIILLSRKIDLNAYTNSEYRNQNYILAY